MKHHRLLSFKVLVVFSIWLVPWAGLHAAEAGVDQSAAIPAIAVGGGKESTIQNRFVTVTFNQDSGLLRAAEREHQLTFIDRALFPERIVGVESKRHIDPALGAGQTLECVQTDGTVCRVRLYEDSPFVHFQTVLRHRGQQVKVVKNLKALRLSLNLDRPAQDLKALGTAGLTAADQHPGSYAFLAVADPETRHGVVGAWLTHDRGSGVVFSSIENDRVWMEAQIDYGHLRVKPGQTEPCETFLVGYFDDARLGLEQYADRIASYYRIQLPPIPTGYCTWYSSPHGGASDQQHIAELAEQASKLLKPFGLEFIQIDDYWQAGQRREGPAKNFYTHNPQGPYPNGMKQPADGIKSLGMMPGLWFMPFAGDRRDPFFQQHPEWFVKKPDGSIYWARWGGSSLDMTHPGARDYVSSIVKRIAQDWGYLYFKIDGVWTGSATELLYVNDGYRPDDIGEAVFHNPDKTNIEALRDGLKLVRKAAGPDVFILGCNVSQNMRTFGGTFGLLDAMRIGPDNGSSFDALKRGPFTGANRYFLHGRVWYNDPDPIYMRPAMPIDHARLICSWVTLSGQLNAFSEWLPDLPPDRLHLLQRTMPNHRLKPRPVDYFEQNMPRIWLLTDTRRAVRRDVISLYNWDDKQPLAIDYPIDRIGLPQASVYVGFDYWADRFVPPFSAFDFTVEKGSCRVLAIRPSASYPQLLSTSRHIAQGIVDVSEETWDPQFHALSGRSRIVGNDPYELRILGTVGPKAWRATRAQVAPDNVAVTLSQSGPRVRVQLKSPRDQEIHWTVHFDQAPVLLPAPPAVAGLTAQSDYLAINLKWNETDADCYRVTRNDGPTFMVATASFTDRDFQRGQTYTYRVSSLLWDKESQPAEVTVTAEKELELPPVPPPPALPLTDLKPLTARTGWGRLGRNESCQGNPLTIDGTRSASGMGVHAPSTLVYEVPEEKRRFVATVGLDDEVKTDNRRSVIFKVYGVSNKSGQADRLLAQSPLLCPETVLLWHLDVPIRDPSLVKIRLVVEDAGDGKNADHADWVNAGFLP